MKLEIHIYNHFPGMTEVLSALTQIQGDTQIIMGTQADFDAKVTAINTKLDDVQQKVTDEAAQVKAFIESHPDLDTSALDGVASRLDSLGQSITQIDPDEAPAPEPEPVPEPEA